MTATTFAAALQICGLRLEQAADYLGVDLGQVDAWITGEASPPLDAWRVIADLYRRIEDAAIYAAEQIEPEPMSNHPA